MLPASAVPARPCALLWVTVGADGGAVSMVSVNGALPAPVLPTGSVAWAVSV